MNKLFHGNALEFLKTLADGEAAYAQKNLFAPRSQACEVQAVMGDL